MSSSPPRPHTTLLDGLTAPDLDFQVDLRTAFRVLRSGGRR